jgi:hypothetical protein
MLLLLDSIVTIGPIEKYIQQEHVVSAARIEAVKSFSPSDSSPEVHATGNEEVISPLFQPTEASTASTDGPRIKKILNCTMRLSQVMVMKD